MILAGEVRQIIRREAERRGFDHGTAERLADMFAPAIVELIERVDDPELGKRALLAERLARG